MPDTIGDPSQRTMASLALGLTALEEKIGTRLDASDKAVELLQAQVNRQPTTEAVSENLRALKELTDSRLAALEKLVEAKFDGNKTALDAALKTQEKALEKIESAFSKQFDNVGSRFDDMKERLDRGDGQTKGIDKAWAVLIGAGGLIVAVAGFYIART